MAGKYSHLLIQSINILLHTNQVVSLGVPLHISVTTATVNCSWLTAFTVNITVLMSGRFQVHTVTHDVRYFDYDYI